MEWIRLAKSLSKAFDDYYAVVNGAQRQKPSVTTQQSPAPAYDNEADDTVSESRDDGGARDEVAPKVEYRVQVLANDRRLSLKSAKFKGEKVSEYFDKGLYKYTVGSYRTQKEAEKTMRRLRKKFPQAFVVRMEDGKRPIDSCPGRMNVGHAELF